MIFSLFLILLNAVIFLLLDLHFNFQLNIIYCIDKNFQALKVSYYYEYSLSFNYIIIIFHLKS